LIRISFLRLKGKVAPVLLFYSAQRNEGILGEWRYKIMEVSDQLHAPTALSPDKQPMVPTG